MQVFLHVCVHMHIMCSESQVSGRVDSSVLSASLDDWWPSLSVCVLCSPHFLALLSSFLKYLVSALCWMLDVQRAVKQTYFLPVKIIYIIDGHCGSVLWFQHLEGWNLISGAQGYFQLYSELQMSFLVRNWGQWGGSVGKGICCQAWRPEFDPWDPLHMVERMN